MFLKRLKLQIFSYYVLHHDLTLELMKRLHYKVRLIIVAAWGEGFKNQVELSENVNAPIIYIYIYIYICELEENGNPIFREFTSKFGRPIVKISCENNKLLKSRF